MDIYKVEQRLRYLGYGAPETGKAGGIDTRFKVDGKFELQDQNALQLLEKVVRYGTGAPTAKDKGSASAATVNATATVEATITYTGADGSYSGLELKVTAMALTAAGKKLTVADQAVAKNVAIDQANLEAVAQAKLQAKAKYDQQIEESKKFAPAKFGADGVIEASGGDDESKANRALTLSWLNAYNAPHWMNIGALTEHEGLANGIDMKKRADGAYSVQGWVNRQIKPEDAQGNYGTSWVYDLMQASHITAAKQLRKKPLEFAGAGELGMQLNLGINKTYISEANQKRVNGKDKVLGVVPTTSTGLPNAPAFDARQWSLSNAKALASKLKNPTVDTPYVGKPDNASGENQQDQALLDFLSVFATTQANGADTANPNGYWDDIAIKNANADVIKKALFGDGTTTGGLVNSQNILIGGMAAPLGSEMTAESLRSFMGSVAPASYYADWLKPLQDAMQEFDINTPSRIAAFLSQVKQESGGMKALVENLRYVVSSAAKTFGVFGKSEDAVRDFYEKELGLKAADSTPERYTGWTDALNVKMAEKVYGNTTAKGKEIGNKEVGDGGKYLGYGLKQLTGLYNLTQFTNYLGGTVGAQVLADPLGTIGTDKVMAARSAAWFWSENSAKVGKKTDGLLSNKALTIQWENNGVNDDQEVEFNKISAGVGNNAHLERWENYKNNVRDTLNNGNPFENIRASLTALGMKVQSGQKGKSDFAVSLRPSVSPLPITRTLNLNASALASSATDVDAAESFNFTSELEFQLLSQAEPLLNQSLHSLQEKEMMWIPDFKIKPMLVAALGLSASLSAAAAENFALGICRTARQDHPANIYPTFSAGSYFFKHHKGLFKDNSLEGAKVRLLVPPKHGTLENRDLSNDLKEDRSRYNYLPQAGFVGTDRFVMQVEKSGIKLRIYYVIKALDDVEAVAGYCPKDEWKISHPTLPGAADPTTWLQSAQLSSLLASASQSLTGFSDLAGSAVGNTTGEGAAAQITLDVNAAGHGWYVDATPLGNTDDFLPTADANIWQAKPGSEAAGKMDMLSVLLHEYGHALGLDHTADQHNFMAESLQPGQRKLPTQAEMQLMAQLVGEIKAAQLQGAGGVPVNAPTNNPTDNSTDNPTNDPSAPASLALASLLALRRRQDGEASSSSAVSTNGTAATATAATPTTTPTLQKLLAVNPALQNADFSQGTPGALLAALTTPAAHWSCTHLSETEPPHATPRTAQASLHSPKPVCKSSR